MFNANLIPNIDLLLPTRPPPDRAPQKRNSASSLMEGSREPGTEDILKRLREERAEVPMDFPWDSIKLGKELGTGDFGKVGVAR